MKRVIKIACLILMLLLTICFSGCSLFKKEPVDNRSVYEVLDDLVKQEYANIILSITTEKDNKSLYGNYIFSKNGEEITVDYSFQQFTSFKEVNGELVAPEKEKETLSGKITYKNGKVVDASGDELNISIETISASGLSFDKSYFSNTVSDDKKFVATVKNPNGFMGVTEATEVTVEVAFSSNAIQKITINYKQGDYANTLVYTFA